ncbi:MAG: DUF2169 domain-containing protein [Pigmentiphaga sp.]|uniref:DUF2169 family type VI secretion system accessory protein n=1 Tax=Pigmentiphaga sp. TaxID=1977564 RepID=UPI0029B8EC2F|nr:DUF2169 domain-containing protein [Pigmentiphaga sp.]MDX3905808.1 DUF2169 domain-containing protein [Pigmentiphaga sp.]
MKIVKPFRLGVMHRPFLHEGRWLLGIGVLAMSGLDDLDQLYPEPEMWKMASEELGEGAVLDMAVPKACAEFLVSGRAYTAHQQDKTACAVKVRVAEVEKPLLVFGDRYWLNGRATAPQPFESMPIDWRHAYGGPDHTANPLGRGTVDEVVNGVHVRRLPNIERPDDLMNRPDRKPRPAGYGPLDLSWPERFERIGRAYDQRWLEESFPGFAKDMDWRLFNAAQPDQWWPASGRVPDDAVYEIWNMHPRHHCLRGRLPSWRARCFLTRQGKQDPEAVDLRLTTAWFFPDRERVILVYHGAAPIAEDDASDILNLMPALESAGEPRTDGHYRSVLASRLDPDKGALHMFRDRDLVPDAALGPWLDTVALTEPSSPLWRNARARGEAARADMRQQLLDEGQDPERYAMPASPLEELPDLDGLPGYMEKAEQVEREQRAELEAKRRELRELLASADGPQTASGLAPEMLEAVLDQRADRPKGPPALQTRGELAAMREAVAALPVDPDEPARSPSALMQRMDEHEAALRKLYRLSAHEQAAADPMSPAQSRRVREDIEQRMRNDRNLAHLDLTGADLSGMDLRGATLAGALMECADLQGTRLDGADLTEAVLVRADLKGASLSGANLAAANLSLARCSGTGFQGAILRDTLLEGLEGHDCDFSQSRWEDISLLKGRLLSCSFEAATLKGVMIGADVMLDGLRFDRAVWDKVNVIRATLARLSFTQATLQACAFIDVDADGALDFTDAELRTTCIAGKSSARQSTLRGTRLTQCCLRGIDLAGSDLSGARLENSDLSACGLEGADLSRCTAPDSLFIRARLAGASLRDAVLIDTMLAKADLAGADLRGANLFRADLAQAVLDDTTRLEGSYTRLAKTRPLRREAAA